MTILRSASIERQSKETRVAVHCNLDGTGQAQLDLPIGFLDHMLTALAKHSRFDLSISGAGDTDVDDHHLVEDIGLTLGRALRTAWSNDRALQRFGQAIVPMDESLALVALDISDRASLAWQVALPQPKVGTFDTDLVQEFMRALATSANITLHIYLLQGGNTHHMIEAIFKALGLALRQATRLDAEVDDVPSSKGLVTWREV